MSRIPGPPHGFGVPPWERARPASSAPPPEARVVEVLVDVPAFSTFTADERAWAARLIEAGFTALAKRHHPDRGGTTTAMQALNAVVAKLRAALEIAE